MNKFAMHILSLYAWCSHYICWKLFLLSSIDSSQCYLWKENRGWKIREFFTDFEVFGKFKILMKFLKFKLSKTCNEIKSNNFSKLFRFSRFFKNPSKTHTKLPPTITKPSHNTFHANLTSLRQLISIGKLS